MRTAGQQERHDVIVIGGGQVGLSVSHHLLRRGLDHVLLERAGRIGDTWRDRYDSLRLYSPARYDGLPGLSFPAQPDHFPTGHEMADYLERYARHFELPIRTATPVERLGRAERPGDGYIVTAGDERWFAQRVVVATGPFQRPHIPEFATELDPAITQLHSSQYRNPDQLPAGPALVVGLGHSGADIAYELAATHQTYVSGRSHGQLPFAVDGQVAVTLWPLIIRFLDHVANLDTPLGRKMGPKVRRGGGPLLRYRRGDLLEAGVTLTDARTIGATDGRPTLDDGTVLDVSSVVWCTGFRPDYGWIELPILDDDGWPVQERGVVEDWPGLYVLGIPFLHGFTSMLVFGAGADAAYVADHIRDAADADQRAAA